MYAKASVSTWKGEKFKETITDFLDYLWNVAIHLNFS